MKMLIRLCVVAGAIGLISSVIVWILIGPDAEIKQLMHCIIQLLVSGIVTCRRE